MDAARSMERVFKLESTAQGIALVLYFLRKGLSNFKFNDEERLSDFKFNDEERLSNFK
jgi:hypothetical protein